MSKWEPVPHRFNYWLASNYRHDAPNIASRFWDVDSKCDWALLSCVWHVKNDFGRKIDPVFSVEEIYAASKKEGWLPGDLARVVHACWLGYVADKQREQTDPIVILPPTPEPPPVVVVEEPKELPKVQVPDPLKKPFPWKRVLVVLLGIAGIVSVALPPPWNLLAHYALKLLQAAMGG